VRLLPKSLDLFKIILKKLHTKTEDHQKDEE